MEITGGQKKFFTKQLMHWHNTFNDRVLPWKEEKDPYKIWLSEIILQQTRAQQGLPYYLKFIESYPNIKDLAAAADEDVFRLWQGLGYYNRCRNMLGTARYIANELNGTFPDTYELLITLKGIGPYTAAAIASFAFGASNAVVDGNVYRVLSRFFGIEEAYDMPKGKKIFQDLAAELLFTDDSAAYNQAIMDLGATICSPQLPKCSSCPLQKHCFAFRQDLISSLPFKSKKVKVSKRFFHYLLLSAGDKIWIHQRSGKDIWQDLHELYLIEHEHALDTEGLTSLKVYKDLNINITPPVYEGNLTQKLSHQLIETHFFAIRLEKPQKIDGAQGKWVNHSDLKKIAFPKTLLSFLEKKVYF